MSNTVPKAEARVDYLQTDVNGYQAHYIKAGSGPPVLLVHGGASDSRDWLPIIAGLAPNYTLFAPDLPGYGQNERKAAGYYLSEFSDFILAFMDTLGLQNPLMVGHSFGGRICLDIALQHPERVSKLVLVDSSGLGKVSRFGSVLLTGFWAIRRLFRIPQPYPKFLAREGDDPDWACVNELPDLKIPTLIIWKRHDPYLPLAVARRAADLIPDARLVIITGWGHAPHKKNCHAFSHHLIEYLGSKG